MMLTSQTDLYIMQNEHGLIRIGSAIEAIDRRRKFERYDRCKIAIVSVLTGEGHREKECHSELDKYLLSGGWFDGTSEVRKAISRLVHPNAPLHWPYHFDAAASEKWLAQLNELRAARRARQR